MKKIILLLCSFFTISALIAQPVSYVLKMTGGEVEINEKINAFTDRSVSVSFGGTSRDETLYKDGDYEVRIRFELTSYQGVQRSNLKKNSVRLTTIAIVSYRGKAERRVTERYYYPEKDRTYQELIKTYIGNGMSGTTIKIRFNGELP